MAVSRILGMCSGLSRLVAAAALGLVLSPVAVRALDLALPGNPVLIREIREAAESYALPIGPYAEAGLPVTEVEGAFVQQAWRLEAQSITTLQMLTPIRDQLRAAGYEILLDCAGQECGGFDFRFATRVMPAPDMFVDFFDFRFLSGRRSRADAAPEYLSVLLSRSGSTGYIQLIQVVPGGEVDLAVAGGSAPTFSEHPGAGSDLPLAERLMQTGRVILADLSFKSGTSDLGEGSYASLDALAGLLRANPDLRVALVGHTDTVGGLDPNIALSKRRAQSVLERLVGAYGVPRAQLDAEGMGYLSPVAPNLEQAGREANRRVEAVLLNSE